MEQSKYLCFKVGYCNMHDDADPQYKDIHYAESSIPKKQIFQELLRPENMILGNLTLKKDRLIHTNNIVFLQKKTRPSKLREGRFPTKST